MSANRFFLICAAWAVAAGSLLGNGVVHHALPVLIAGTVMSAICPVGLVVAWCFRRW